MSTDPLDPAQIMAEHVGDPYGKCRGCVSIVDSDGDADLADWPCLPYRLAGDVRFAQGERDAEEDRANRLAEALTAERARVQRVEAEIRDWRTEADEDERWLNGPRVSVGEAQTLPSLITQTRRRAHLIHAALAGDTEGSETPATEAGYRCEDCAGWFTVSHTCGDRGQHVHIVHTTPFPKQVATS